MAPGPVANRLASASRPGTGQTAAWWGKQLVSTDPGEANEGFKGVIDWVPIANPRGRITLYRQQGGWRWASL